MKVKKIEWKIGDPESDNNNKILVYRPAPELQVRLTEVSTGAPGMRSSGVFRVVLKDEKTVDFRENHDRLSVFPDQLRLIINDSSFFFELSFSYYVERVVWYVFNVSKGNTVVVDAVAYARDFDIDLECSIFHIVLLVLFDESVFHSTVANMM